MTDFELRPPERVNLADHNTGREHLSHSALGTFLACQQRYGWAYQHRLERAVTAAPLQLGRAFAHALEHGNPDEGERLLREDHADQVQLAAGNPWVTTPDPTQLEINATVVREAARAYLVLYGAHHQTREVELRARIRNPARGGRYSHTHDLLGRVDAVTEDFTTMIEDKLVGQIPRASLAARLRLDRQVSIGAYLIWRTTGTQVREVRYRMTLKPGIRQRKDETFDQYLARIATEYEQRPDHYLVEEIATREPEDFLRLEQELWTWVEQIREARRTGVWPRNTAACHDYGGCAFLPLCAREPGAMNEFREREQRDPRVSAPDAPSVRDEPIKEAA